MGEGNGRKWVTAGQKGVAGSGMTHRAGMWQDELYKTIR